MNSMVFLYIYQSLSEVTVQVFVLFFLCWDFCGASLVSRGLCLTAVYTPFYTLAILANSSYCWLLAYFQTFVITSSAVVSILVCKSWCREGISLNLELLSHWVCVYSVSLKADKLLPQNSGTHFPSSSISYPPSQWSFPCILLHICPHWTSSTRQL